MTLKLKLYAALGSMLIVLFGFGYVSYLRWQVKDYKSEVSHLEDTNLRLKLDLKASRDQITVLSEREIQNKKTEAEYAKLVKELKSKENGPVADVLRFAIDSDLVRP